MYVQIIVAIDDPISSPEVLRKRQDKCDCFKPNETHQKVVTAIAGQSRVTEAAPPDPCNSVLFQKVPLLTDFQTLGHPPIGKYLNQAKVSRLNVCSLSTKLLLTFRILSP
jgi:hypothetical protein